MDMTLRWFGEGVDSVSLEQIRQIPGVKGVITTLYDIPAGEEWPMERILQMKEKVEAKGLKVMGIESVNIHDAIKVGTPDREKYIANYITTLERLGQADIHVVCYNFMPVFDWTRTDMAYVLPDGSDCLAFEAEKVNKIDARKGIDLPGWGTNYSPEKLQELLQSYENIDEDQLWENCKYFLDACIPVAEECGVKLALHPDDPPRPIFGLPRIAKNVEDYRRILGYIKSPANAITFCCGSFGSSAENDMPVMIREFGKEKIPFVHFRNIKLFEDGSFYECGHVTESGSSDMGEVMRALHDIGFDGYLRPDHGRRIWDEAWSIQKVKLPDGTEVEEHRPDGFNGIRPAAGYGLFDRALGAAYALGLWEGLEKR